MHLIKLEALFVLTETMNFSLYCIHFLSSLRNIDYIPIAQDAYQTVDLRIESVYIRASLLLFFFLYSTVRKGLCHAAIRRGCN